MRANFLLLLLLSIIGVTSSAHDVQLTLLNIGDSAPPLRVREWLKGEPIQRFEKGKVYVVEFWATWCAPCKAAMPHLSALAAEYKDRLTILGIDIYEKKSASIKDVKAFVDSMGSRMDYNVAAEDSNFMETGWLDASGEQGVPKSFVVNTEGRLAWIGHPMNLDEVLPKILNNIWDIKESLAKRNLDKYLAKLDEEISFQLKMYVGDAEKPDDLGKPDWALLVINEIITNNPKLKYAPLIAYHTFSSLLKTNPNKAYEYGKVAIITSTYEDAAYDAVIDAIEWYSDKLNLPVEIYQLGTEAYQAKIDKIPYPEIVNMYKLYHKMAAWYWRINNKLKAIDASQKAIETMKSKKDFSTTDMAAYEAQLKQYQKNSQ